MPCEMPKPVKDQLYRDGYFSGLVTFDDGTRAFVDINAEAGMMARLEEAAQQEEEYYRLQREHDEAAERWLDEITEFEQEHCEEETA